MTNTPQWREEMERRINSDNYPKDEWNDINAGTDTLLCESYYPENEYELDKDKIEAFIETQIAQARREERELREKYPYTEEMVLDIVNKVQKAKEQGYKQGFEDCKVAYENGIKSALSISNPL